MRTTSELIPLERISSRIHLIRGVKVMIDADLARLYAVNVKALNQAVKRNLERFPEDFMFRLNAEELSKSRSPNVTTSTANGGTRYPPYAFTELGVGMLSSVLRSPRAVQVNIDIMRAFVELRRYALTHEDLNRKLDSLVAKTDRRFRAVIDAIRKLMAPEAGTDHKPTRGFGR